MARIEWFFEIEDEYGQKWELLRATGGLHRMAGLRLPPGTRVMQRTPTQHGSEDVGFRLENREIVIGVNYDGAYVGPYGKSPLMEQRARGPYKVLGYLSGALVLRAWRKDGTVRELRRSQYGGGMEGDSDNVYQDFEEIAFLLLGTDPPWYDTDGHSITSVYDDFSHGVYASTLSLSSADGLMTGGDWYTYPTIIITGPCTDFDLVSITTGQRLRFTMDMVDGDVVTIETNPKIVTATDAGGVDVRQYIPPGDDFGGFRLDAHPESTDGENAWELTVQGIGANSTFVFTWEDRYQGL